MFKEDMLLTKEDILFSSAKFGLVSQGFRKFERYTDDSDSEIGFFDSRS